MLLWHQDGKVDAMSMVNRVKNTQLRTLERENEALRLKNRALARENAELRAYRHLAFRDPLTGLWNRRYAYERMDEEVARAERGVTRDFSVVMIDIDHFKVLNDTAGHEVGDQALQWLATWLKRNVRGHDLCCRLGGDEFLVILPGLDEASVGGVCARLHAALELANRERAYPIRISLGSATYGVDGHTVKSLLRASDHAMYDKKRARDGAGFASDLSGGPEVSGHIWRMVRGQRPDPRLQGVYRPAAAAVARSWGRSTAA